VLSDRDLHELRRLVHLAVSGMTLFHGVRMNFMVQKGRTVAVLNMIAKAFHEDNPGGILQASGMSRTTWSGQRTVE